MDAHTLKVLEWRKVLDRLAAHTATGMGREAAFNLAPAVYPEVVNRALQETREAKALLDRGAGMPLGGIRDIRQAVDRAAIEFPLAPIELLDVAQTVAAARRLRTFLVRGVDDHPLLAEIGGNLPVLPGIETRIEEAIAANGEVRDSATPDLARLRSQRKLSHNRLMERLNSIVAGERYRTFIQEPIVTLREGRYCIPVKAEFRGQLGGIVHDASASGATVFVEPGSCVELGNELKEIAVREEQEVARILGRLTALIGAAAAEMRQMLETLRALDLANAKAALALEMDASEPRVNRDGLVRLRAARHPLLTGAVVPIDIEIGATFSILLITGPNTGGKTVALKTVGLMAIMAQSGLQIPASPDTDLALFDQVFADIGDEQDIEQSLSTFSAHLRNIVHITGALRGSALVLLDEVGAGTDPAEGAALAKAILSALKRAGARVLATTHYGELKEYAYANAGVENAAVEFDRETLRPTYRVLLGVPGSSHALYIAGRLGLAEAIIEEARANLSTRDRTTSELLQQIEASRRHALELERDAELAGRAAAAAREEYERRAREVADVQRTVRREAQEEAREVLRRASEKAENILDELRKMNRGKRKGSTARQELAALRTEVAGALEEPEEPEAESAPPGGYALRRGDRVRVTSLGAEGTLIEDPREGIVAVQVGSMRATLPVDVLRPASAKPDDPARRARSSAAEISMRKAIHISPDLTIRALRVDEAAPMLEKYLDDAYAAGIAQVRIIHGKGTGALRRFVGDTLRVHPVVGGFRAGDDGEGGEGVTIVTFKE